MTAKCLHIQKLLLDQVVDFLGELFLDLRHDLFSHHDLVVLLVMVSSLIAVCPLGVVVFVVAIKFAGKFSRTNLHDVVLVLLLFIFLSLLLFSLFLLLLGFGVGGILLSLLDGSFFFRGCGGLLFKTFVKFIEVVRDFTKEGPLLGDPVAAFFEELCLDIISFSHSNFLSILLAFHLVFLLVTKLDHFLDISGLLSSYQRIVSSFDSSLRSTNHA